jgi:hypothetical protein
MTAGSDDSRPSTYASSAAALAVEKGLASGEICRASAVAAPTISASPTLTSIGSIARLRVAGSSTVSRARKRPPEIVYSP